MKKILLLLIAMVMCVTVYGDVTPPAGYFHMPMSGALGFVKRHFSDKPNADYFCMNADVPTDTNPESKWTFFVDPTPDLGWEHPCYVAMFPKFLKTGTNPLDVSIKTIYMTMPPTGTLTPVSVNVNNASTTAVAPVISKRSLSAAQQASASKTYAVILSGGGNKNSNYERYWNDCSFIYQVLTKRYGVPKSHIYPIMSDGNNPAADMRKNNGECVSQPLDLDSDGINEIELAATTTNLSNTFTKIKNVIQPGDQFFLFVIDHGGKYSTSMKSYIVLWNNARLDDNELANMLIPFVSKSVAVNVILGQCHSGGFIDDLKKTGCVVSTASKWEEYSHARSNLLYDEFVYHWTSAINQATENNVSVKADYDGDGIVSMDEAFKYAQKKDIYIPMSGDYKETPQYSSMPVTLGEDLAFDNIPPLTDLYLRDNPEDMGRMPNKTTDKNWLSPDVWVRNANDNGTEYQNPYYSSTHKQAYIYVRVHNRGIKTFTGTKWLHMHWALASSGFTYKTWTGKDYDSNGRCIGEHMPAVKIPAISAGSSTIIKIPWTLPGELMTNTDPVSHHFCLFAKITDSQTDAKSIDGTRYYDVLNSKLQAQRNVTIVDAKSASKGVSVYVRNPEETQQTFSLELVPRTGADEALYQKASIGMEMAPKISAGWQQGGMRVMNMSDVPAVNTRGNRVVRFASPDNRIESISLGAEEFDKVTLRFDFDKFATDDETYTFDLIQRAEDGTIVGGETFVINAPRQSAEEIGIATAEKADGTVELAAVGNAGFETLSWTDASGNEIGTGSTVSVTPTAQNSEFTVKAYTADGKGAKASVSLEPARGIRSVETDGRDVAVVTLISAAGRDSRLVVTSVLNNTECMNVPLAEGAVKEEIDLSTMPQGVYAVTYIAGENVVGTVKFTR